MTELEQSLRDIGIFPVVTVRDAAHAAPLARVLCEEGIPAAEVTFRAPGAGEAIARMREAAPQMLVGAGTVLTRAHVDEARAAGACFAVSPGLDPDIVSYCQEVGLPILPGCATPSDLAMACRLGLHTVKFFPAAVMGGVAALRAMSAPYPLLHFVPTGGIGPDTVSDYLSFAPVLACGGSYIVRDADLARGDMDAIRATVASAVSRLFDFRLWHVGCNAAGPQEAAQATALLSAMFGQPVREAEKATFYGSWLEVMHRPGRGQHGHIGIETAHIERAVAYFRRRGFAFAEESAVRDAQGRLQLIYFRDEILGFAFHLTARQA